MGQINTAQAVEIIDAVREPNMSFWPLLLLAVIPVILAPFVATWFKRRNK